MADVGSAISGTSGSFSFAGHNFRVKSWSLTGVRDINDASGFTSGGVRRVLPGMKGWRLSASGYAIYNAANTAPAADFSASNEDTGISFTLTAITGCTYAGTAFASQMVVGADIDGNDIVQFSAVCDGAVTETWDVTP